MERQKYLFRRQYILGPEYAYWLGNWSHYRLKRNLYLTAHPELSVTTVSQEDDFLVLLGYILDPFHPEKNDQEILGDLFSKIVNPDDLFAMLDHMGGRFVLIGHIAGVLRVLNDAAGFRQVFYHTDQRKRIWCAGLPSLIAEQCGLEKDHSVCNELVRLPLFKNNESHWFPAGFSYYQNVFHLLPNHYLDMGSGSVRRFWPLEDIESRSSSDTVEYVSRIMEGMMESAAARFEHLAIAITSGIDSRIILSASRKICDRLIFFTYTHNELSPNGPDIAVPSSMLPHFGLKHTPVKGQGHEVDPTFMQLIYRNIPMPKMNQVRNAYTMHNYIQKTGREFVVTNGTCGEITRNNYFIPKVLKLNGPLLAAIVGMRGSRFVSNAFSEWLDGIKDIVRKRSNKLDLFYWEQTVGNWAAMAYSEYDISFESFSPQNCRSLLAASIGVNPCLRNPPKHKYQVSLIKAMWPEVLRWDINPVPNKVDLLIQRCRRTPVHSFYKTIKLMPCSQTAVSLSRRIQFTDLLIRRRQDTMGEVRSANKTALKKGAAKKKKVNCH
ncbi:MAG: hypothetical protein ACLFVQ_03305 [Chitinispirillaceae bacterium]